MTSPRHSVRGYLYIATAAFFWATGANLGRAAFTGKLAWFGSLDAIDPLIISQARTTISFLVIFPVLLALRGRSQMRLPAVDFGRAMALGVLGLAASNYFYYLAIQRMNVAIAIIVQYTAPVWVLLYMTARGLQKLSWSRAISVGLAMVGIATVVGIGSGTLRPDAKGIGAALLAAFAFAFYNIAGHSFLERYDHWTVVMFTAFSAALFWMFINPPWKIAAAHYSGKQWLFLLIFSLVSMLIPFSFYFAGLKYLEPTRAIIVSCLEPVFSIVLAALFLRETMRPLQVLGIVFVLLAIVAIQLPSGASSKTETMTPVN